MLSSVPAHAEITAPAPDPALNWTARADWIDAEDGTIVALRPGYDISRHSPVPTSDAAWPARRALIEAAPKLLVALEALVAIIERLPDAKHDSEFEELGGAACRAAHAARAAIAQARATW